MGPTHLQTLASSHPDGRVVEGLLDCHDVVPSAVVIDQLRGSTVAPCPLLQSSVSGSRGALTALAAHPPALDNWTTDLAGWQPRWRQVFAWVWAGYHQRKTSDFLWKLMHRVLSLGIERRRWSADIHCALCADTIETYDHLFHTCTTTAAVWAWFAQAWHRAFNHRLPPGLRGVIFAAVSPRRLGTPFVKLRRIILGVCHGELLYCLWRLRCRALLDNDHPAFNHTAIRATAIVTINSALDTLAATQRFHHIRDGGLADSILRAMRSIPI